MRPGFHITVNSLTINADRKAVVDLSFTDDAGQPLDRAGNVTPGPLSTSFILAWYDGGMRQYTAYTTRKQTSPITGVTAIQAGTDSGGGYQDLDIGHTIYTFGTALPEGYDVTKTHTLGIYGTRDLIDVAGGDFTKNYVANVEHDFRPDGAALTDVWNLLSNEACNTCHNPLSAHGGARQDVKLCVLCHSPQTTDPDTGNTVDFKVMIHKIHRGADLPSVGGGNAVPDHRISAEHPADFSTVESSRRTSATARPATAPEAAPGAVSWYTNPSAAACTSCHDDVNLATGMNHGPGPQPDGSCAGCHRPQGDQEWDVSILGAHTVPYKSAQLKGVKAEIVSVTNTAPGQNPTVLFTVTQNDGTPIPPSAFTVVNTNGSTSSGLNLVMSGPTTDYSIPPQIRERADGAAASGANSSYTFTTPIPPDATGTWGFSIEARLTVTLNPAPRDATTVRDSAFNPVAYAPVTDTEAVPRRMVVDIANCNKCHDRLALHGGNRLNPLECVFCHNPNGTRREGAPRVDRLQAHDPQDSHRCGPDARLQHWRRRQLQRRPLPGRPARLSEVPHHGRERSRHRGGRENPPPGLLATATPRDWYTPMQHYATACLACHDSQAAAAHAFVMTAPFGEACATCHGPDALFSVDKMHAR